MQKEVNFRLLNSGTHNTAEDTHILKSVNLHMPPGFFDSFYIRIHHETL